ncbi:hypothetical protein STRDD11_02516 [Streptococcus sp. DD11]|nr:hypothetical protein STRDD11_02516 [Streptococcus sp. DD11]
MLKADMALHLSSIYFCCPSLCDFRLIQDMIEPLCTGKGALQFRQDRRNVIKRLGILVDIVEKGHQLTDRKGGTADNPHSPKAYDKGINEGIDKAGGRIDRRGVEDGRLRIVGVGAVAGAKGLHKLFLSIKGLNQTLLPQALLNQLGLPSARLSLLLKKAVAFPSNEAGDKKRERCQQQDQEHHENINLSHGHNGDKNGQQTDKKLIKDHEQAVIELVQVRGQTADHIACPLTIQIGKGQTVNLLNDLLAQLFTVAVDQTIVEQRVEPLDQSIGSNDQGHLSQNRQQLPAGIRQEHTVHCIADQHRQIDGQTDLQQGSQTGQQKKPAGLQQIMAQTFQTAAFVLTCHGGRPPYCCAEIDGFPGKSQS